MKSKYMYTLLLIVLILSLLLLNAYIKNDNAYHEESERNARLGFLLYRVMDYRQSTGDLPKYVFCDSRNTPTIDKHFMEYFENNTGSMFSEYIYDPYVVSEEMLVSYYHFKEENDDYTLFWYSGPDKMYQLTNEKIKSISINHLYNLTYDPSNGSNSKGDVIAIMKITTRPLP